MMSTRRLILSFSMVILCMSGLFAQSWTFIKEKEGIKIYTRDEPNTNLKSFKGIMTMKARMDQVGHLVGNVENFDWWDDDIKKIDVLAYEKDKLIRYYLIYDVPWPLSDRDLCVEAKIALDPVTGEKTVYAQPLANLVPEDPDMVRIKKYYQKWSIKPQKDNTLLLTLEGFVDPGGNVPSWLYNMVITDTPLKVMSSLKEEVFKTKGSSK